MVNWVQVYRKHVLALVAKNAGLRQHAVEVDDTSTVINFWLPRHKAPEEKQEHIKHPVVLVHGFAGDGIMTWWPQVGALSHRGYDVYVPDLIHFGCSTSPSADRSAGFQARCLAAALQKLGVVACDVVGFSYGGLVAFEMAAAHPCLVRSVVVSGASTSYSDAEMDALLGRCGAGARTLTEMLLPESAQGVRSLLSNAMYMKLWLPRRFLEDFLKAMISNRKERGEMLEEMVTRDKKPTPAFHQNIFLLWGEHDNLIPIEDATSLKEELGEKVMLRSISKAGHLANLERPCIYNRCLEEFLAHVNAPSS